MWERLLVEAYARAPRRVGRAAVRATTPSYRVGVVAVAVRPDGRVLLVDQSYVEGWSLPGGDLRRGESLRDGLARELREELGLRLDVATPELAVQRVHDHWVTFVAPLRLDDATADALRPSPPELTGLGWFDAADLPRVHDDAGPPLRLGLRWLAGGDGSGAAGRSG